jgi:large subunit ribosomal protein L15
MQTHEIRRATPYKKAKLVGRGGKRGKTAGKGGKGQTARAGHRVRPAMRDIIKKLPKLRGHGKNRAKSVFYRGPEAVVNVGALNAFSAGDIVSPTSLIAKGLLSSTLGKHPKIKILGNGELTVKVTIERCEVSETAKDKIIKAGGTINHEEKPKPHKVRVPKEPKAEKETPAKKGK